MGSTTSQSASSITLAVFDLDGTLVDSLGDIASAANHVLAATGREPLPREAFPRFVGAGVTELLRLAAPSASADELVGLERHFRAHYAGNLTVETRPYPGVPELLERLEARAIRLAVLSNKPHAMTEVVVATLFPDTPWIAVLGQREDIDKKPDPTGLLEIIARAAASPAETVMVGDTAVDIETAIRGGATALGVAWGFRSADELRQGGAEIVAESAAELADRILTIS